MLLEVFPTKMERWSAKNSLIIWASFNNRGKLQGVPIIQLSFPISVVGWTENIICSTTTRQVPFNVHTHYKMTQQMCIIIFPNNLAEPVTQQKLYPPSGQCKLIVIVKKKSGGGFCERASLILYSYIYLVPDYIHNSILCFHFVNVSFLSNDI